MIKSHLNWDDLRLLEAVADRGSLLGAARFLGTSVSTVSRRLSKLELAVDAVLLERDVDGCRLTFRGQTFLDIARQTSRLLDRELASSSEAAPLRGTIKISSGDGFQDIVLDEIAEFSDLHPHCAVEYSVETEYRKVARGDVDVAIRVAHHGEPSLVYRKIMDIEYGVFCSAAFARRLSDQSHVEDIPLVGLLPPLSHEDHMKAARAAGFINAKLRVSSLPAQLAAVRRGVGAAVLPKLAADSLVALAPKLGLPTLPVFIVTRLQVHDQPHLGVFVDRLTQRFARIGPESS